MHLINHLVLSLLYIFNLKSFYLVSMVVTDVDITHFLLKAVISTVTAISGFLHLSLCLTRNFVKHRNTAFNISSQLFMSFAQV